METIQNKINLPLVNVGSSFKQFSPLRWVFILLTGFTAANVGVRSLALTASVPSNPFVAYADIFPGQPASAIEARRFSCPSVYDDYQPPTGLYCTLTPVDDVFSNVTVVIFGGTIHQMTFIMRENRLTVGDLELIFETRAVHKFPHVAYFALPRQGSFAITDTIDYARRLSVFLPVRSITFIKIALPIG